MKPGATGDGHYAWFGERSLLQARCFVTRQYRIRHTQDVEDLPLHIYIEPILSLSSIELLK